MIRLHVLGKSFMGFLDVIKSSLIKVSLAKQSKPFLLQYRQYIYTVLSHNINQGYEEYHITENERLSKADNGRVSELVWTSQQHIRVDV